MRFRYWPWKMSTMSESSRIRYTCHSCSLATCVGSRSSSASRSGVRSILGFCRIRFRSSCRPSSRKLRNSCESCCSEPENCGAWLQMDLCGMLLVSGGPQTKSS